MEFARDIKSSLPFGSHCLREPCALHAHQPQLRGYLTMGLFVRPHRRQADCIDCGKLLSLGSNRLGKQTWVEIRGVRIEHFSYPTRMMLTRTRTRTRPVPKIDTRPDATRGYTRTRSLPVGLPLLGIIGLVAYPRPGPLHCISSDESIFCCGEQCHVLHALQAYRLISSRVPGEYRLRIRIRHNYDIICGL